VQISLGCVRSGDWGLADEYGCLMMGLLLSRNVKEVWRCNDCDLRGVSGVEGVCAFGLLTAGYITTT
jgi:hypothetical protein